MFIHPWCLSLLFCSLQGRGLSLLVPHQLFHLCASSCPSCFLWDLILSVAPFPVFLSFSSLLAPRKYAQVYAFYLFDLTKAFSNSSFIFRFLPRIFAASTSQVHLNLPYQSHWHQQKLFSDLLHYYSASSSHLLSPGPLQVFLNSSPYPQSTLFQVVFSTVAGWSFKI